MKRNSATTRILLLLAFFLVSMITNACTSKKTLLSVQKTTAMISSRLDHVNLVARDWKRLARFYKEVFGCVQIYPSETEKEFVEFTGQWIEEGTGVPGARISGVYLQLPGCGDDGPSLEIFQYNHQKKGSEIVPNRPGYGHIAFDVDDIKAARDAVISAGGKAVGKIASKDGAAFVYLTDPEGNIIELIHFDDE